MITEEKKQAFLKDLFELYEKHGIAISHEDYHGGFKLVPTGEKLIEWMSDCGIDNDW